MKKFLLLIAVFTIISGITTEARAGLDFSISLGIPFHSYRNYDDCYRPVVRYYRPQPRYYEEGPRYYRSSRRTRVYYGQPVYRPAPVYYRSDRYCD